MTDDRGVGGGGLRRVCTSYFVAFNADAYGKYVSRRVYWGVVKLSSPVESLFGGTVAT